jgi:DNA-binding phage protein
LSIEAEDCEPSHLLDALAIAAKARIINQLAQDASIDRRMLCNMFQDSPGNSKPPTIDQTTIIKIAHSFAIPVPTLHKELITT